MGVASNFGKCFWYRLLQPSPPALVSIVMAQKRQKTMLLSWSGALQENPWGATQDDITSIADAIEATGCTLTTFLTFNDNLRGHMLRSIDGLEWVDDILGIIKDLEVPSRDDPIELLNAGRLSPSGRKLKEVLPLIRHTRFKDAETLPLLQASDFSTFMFKTPLQSLITAEIDTNFEDFTCVLRAIRVMEDKVMDFRVKVPSGIPVLNGHIVSLILGLSDFRA